ncbi:hypothetical protein LXA43DRAFT_524920 [Ganoderma leucocontextum]|nr:hypothetical protein LXA43DRAFT_524920 [Ganoderma leucocontextum]
MFECGVPNRSQAIRRAPDRAFYPSVPRSYGWLGRHFARVRRTAVGTALLAWPTLRLSSVYQSAFRRDHEMLRQILTFVSEGTSHSGSETGSHLRPSPLPRHAAMQVHYLVRRTRASSTEYEVRTLFRQSAVAMGSVQEAPDRSGSRARRQVILKDDLRLHGTPQDLSIAHGTGSSMRCFLLSSSFSPCASVQHFCTSPMCTVSRIAPARGSHR